MDALLCVQPEAAGGLSHEVRTSETQTVRYPDPSRDPSNPEASYQRGRQPADTRSPELRLQKGPPQEGAFTLCQSFTFTVRWRFSSSNCQLRVSLQASKRLESGEISQEDFLNMAHQIKHFFQYQEEKQQRSESWDAAADFPMNKLLGTPPNAQPRPHDGMDAAELSYYEHKSKLRKTQVNHRVAGEDWEGEETLEDGVKVGQGEKTGGPTPQHKYGRAPRDRQGELRSCCCVFLCVCRSDCMMS